LIWPYADKKNKPKSIQASQGVNLRGTQGNEAPDVDITLSQMQNGEIFDRAATAELFKQRARSDQSTQQQQSGQAQSPSLQDAQISSLTPQIFYDEDKNPIMKAFKSSGGKGLAGVITSFKVDYSEAKANWGTDGSELLRAPMFVTIQLQMAVIHDITPGLDANGIMNAPIWPVGKASNYFIQNPSDSSVQTQTPRAGQPATNQVGNIDKFAVDGTVPLYYNRKD